MKDDYGTGNILVGLRVTPDDRVRIDVDLQLSCAGETFVYNEYTFTAVAVIGPDLHVQRGGHEERAGFGKRRQADV